MKKFLWWIGGLLIAVGLVAAGFVLALGVLWVAWEVLV